MGAIYLSKVNSLEATADFWARAYSHEVATGIIPVTANTGNPVFFKLETIVQLSNASCKLSKTGFSPCLMPVPALSREPL